MKCTDRRSSRIRIAAAGILFLLLWCVCASAEKERIVSARCPSRSEETVLARNGWNGLTLSVPGYWDLTCMTLEADGSGKLYLGQERREITAGEPADLSDLAGRKTVVRDDQNRTIGNLTILQGSRIPALFLEADAEEVNRVNHNKYYEITAGRAAYIEADGTTGYDGTLDQLKGRGNNSYRYTKKPYQIKLGEKTSLGGMGKSRTWVLLAEWTDISLLRNRIVLDMSREIGLKNAVKCEHTDLWINGVYQGLYLLTEKIQIGKERIPITNLEKATEKVNETPLQPGKLVKEKTGLLPLMRSYPDIKDPEDITGGYIAVIEKFHRMRDNALAGFRTGDGLSIQIKEPTCPSRAQTEYLAQRITEMQHALMSPDGIAPETGKSYEEYLDVPSFARKFLIEDWCKNYDFIGGSQFLYKDSDLVDPLIYAGPSWDYDLSFGNMLDRGHAPGARYITATRKSSNLYWLLYGQEGFRKQVTEIWKEVFRPAAEVLLGERAEEGQGILKSIDAYRAEIEASAEMNTARWGVNSAASAADAGGSFDKAVQYLTSWIAERTAWMDSEYGKDE